MEFAKFEGQVDQKIKTELLHVLSSLESQKRMNIQEFLEGFKVSNSGKKKIKERILFLICLLQKTGRLESRFQIEHKVKADKVKDKVEESIVRLISYQTELTLELLSEAKYLIFFENTSFTRKR